MRLRALIDEDFVNYKKPAMFLGTISCDGKCCKEAGLPLTTCQNHSLKENSIVNIDNSEIAIRYINNPITRAIVIGGLEPFEQWGDIYCFIWRLRSITYCNDDVVIYTGFYPDEIQDKLAVLKRFPNIIVKFGRFVPNGEKHFDEVLGVWLANKEQYAEVIS